ncbi:hypothetical protein SCHPADRAFT_885185 [Schizopora paradoxa]|uniref:Uncharacterized protein n=1 Tax=Schizopora paradoxa TaxID=27342 RepID=A0A0H2S7Q2_9AGAM|nr:hypothetical protein SCHPADRAFT_885185 [Schizopora paradoxa]
MLMAMDKKAQGVSLAGNGKYARISTYSTLRRVPRIIGRLGGCGRREHLYYVRQDWKPLHIQAGLIPLHDDGVDGRAKVPRPSKRSSLTFRKLAFGSLEIETMIQMSTIPITQGTTCSWRALKNLSYFFSRSNSGYNSLESDFNDRSWGLSMDIYIISGRARWF